MKRVFAAMLMLLAGSSFANINWNDHELGQSLATTKKIELQYKQKLISIPKGSKVRLLESSELNMIKVHLKKYQLEKCPSRSIQTELELVPVKQVNDQKTSVGVNLAKDCVMEIFVEMKDHNTNSFFN